MQKSIEQWMISEVPVRLMRLVSEAAAIWPDHRTSSAASQWIWNWRASRRVPDGEDHLSRGHITAVLPASFRRREGAVEWRQELHRSKRSPFFAAGSLFHPHECERALIYTEEDLHHRMLVLYEADAIARGGRGAYLLRTLLSEGEIRHETVEKAGKGFATKKITKAGPTGLIVTTTATGLEPELETRLLSLTVTDTPEQTKAVFQALARNDHSLGTVQVDYERWHGLQNWLTAGERNVVIPFAEQLADRVLALAVRQRRDFGALLPLIRAHALLHRASRDRNEAGAIIANIADYAVVRELVAELFAEGIEATVSTTVRETVDAVEAVKKDEVSLGELAAKLALDKSAASRRLREAIDRGYLLNRETRKGRPARVVLGDPMPEKVKLLPEPCELAA